MKDGELKLYTIDRNGDPREVKIMREPADIIAVRKPDVRFPEYEVTPEISMEVQGSDSFVKELQAAMDELDRKISEKYRRYEKALQCCLGAPRGACHECPLAELGRGNCRKDLLENILVVLRNHEELKKSLMMGGNGWTKEMERKKIDGRHQTADRR